MTEVRGEGLRAARHLRGDIYEVRADGENATFRILFAPEGRRGQARAGEGRRGQVLLALAGFAKKSQKTPENVIRVAERRLRLWRVRSLA